MTIRAGTGNPAALSLDEIPAAFDTEFLDWFRDRTEAYWESLPELTPKRTLRHFVKQETGGSLWQRGTRWLGGLDDGEIEEIERRWNLRFPVDYRRFLQRLDAPDRGMMAAGFVDRSDGETGRGVLPLGRRRWFRAGRFVEPDREHGELARAHYGRYQDMVLTEDPSFYNWSRDTDAIEALLAWVVSGLEFDVECNGLWAPSWGAKPATVDDQKRCLRGLVEAAPRLIPVYGHRCLVGESGVAANPVLSIWQSDIVVYGADLRDYLLHDFSDLLGLSDEAQEELEDAIGERIGAAEPVHHSIPFWGELLAINA
jgi:hypothetical protein